MEHAATRPVPAIPEDVSTCLTISTSFTWLLRIQIAGTTSLRNSLSMGLGEQANSTHKGFANSFLLV